MHEWLLQLDNPFEMGFTAAMNIPDIIFGAWAGAMLTSLCFATLGTLLAAVLFRAKPSDINIGMLPAFSFIFFGITINIGWLQIGTSSFDYGYAVSDVEYDAVIEDFIDSIDESGEYFEDLSQVIDQANEANDIVIFKPRKVALSCLMGILVMSIPALYMIGLSDTLTTIETALRTMWLMVSSPNESVLPPILEVYAAQPIWDRIGQASAAFVAFNLLPIPLLAGGRFILAILGMLGVPNRFLMGSTLVIVLSLLALIGLYAYFAFRFYVAMI